MPEKNKKKYTYGDVPLRRTQRVFELLMDCAFLDIVLEVKETCKEKLTVDPPQYMFKVTKQGLIAVANRKCWENGKSWEFGDEKDQRWTNEIYPALSHYLGDGFLDILEGGGQQGSSDWSFTLRLWHSDKAENLKTFADKWQEARQARSKVAIPQTKKADQDIDWRTACKDRLELEKKQITSSPLLRKGRDLDSVHVPLGLVERKERPKVDRAQEISPERWAAEQPEHTEKRVEHDAFLAEIGKRQPGEHVVILGEPGAGKTTLLMKVWEWLLDYEQPGEDIIVAWVPLTAVEDYNLAGYLKESWIGDFIKLDESNIDHLKSFQALADAGRVWLLLDGADEMGGEALSKLETTLKANWARSTRAIITCRLNFWDASSTNRLQTSPNFQVYRTLDFKYKNPAGEDEVESFINNWFQSTEEPEAGQKLRAALDEVGKERIKDLAKNPLRLTLLCAIWEDDQALPETQAGLYKLFVDYVYDWKAEEFSEAVKLRGEIDQALGNLAKQGLNKPNLRFRFTEAELRKWVPVFEQRQALMDLGWLNCAGEENKRPVFAFFHPTFQEYFAACNIDDWDYFLPRAHVDRPVACQGEDVPTYRVTERHWRYVILLWIEKVSEDRKIIDFRDHMKRFNSGCGDSIYHERKFDIYVQAIDIKISKTTISVAEYKSEFDRENDTVLEKDALYADSDKSDKEIIVAAIKLCIPPYNENSSMCYSDRRINHALSLGKSCSHNGFNDFLQEEIPKYLSDDPTTKLLLSIVSFASDAHCEWSLDILNDLGTSAGFHDRISIAYILFDSDKVRAVDILNDILRSTTLSSWAMSWLSQALIDLCRDEEKIIDSIIEKIRDPQCDKSIRQGCIRTLGYIDGNKKSSSTLENLLKDEDTEISIKDSAIRTLGAIARGDETVKSILIELFEKKDSDLSPLLGRVLSMWLSYPEFYYLCNKSGSTKPAM